MFYKSKSVFFVLLLCISITKANEVIGCGGFVKSNVNLDFSKVEIGLYTAEGSLKEKTECAPMNGYYFLPLYEKGAYVLKIHPPPGWSFEPSEVSLVVDGETDHCSTGQDINFAFNGFGITGVIKTIGHNQGPRDVSVQLVAPDGSVRETVTTDGGNFHFTPVIPGKYTLKASHPRWLLEPSKAVVEVREGNTALPDGVLAVKGYDVRGSITYFEQPIKGIKVLLYSEEKSVKVRVEGCDTSLLQGVSEGAICHSETDAAGEFQFGAVPAGRWRLVVWSQNKYDVSPEAVPFTVLHDSIYIKNAFEVRGVIVGSSVTGATQGVTVSLNGRQVTTTDAGGRYALPALPPGEYHLTFHHDDYQIEGVTARVEASGEARVERTRVARWRVCGTVMPAARAVAVDSARVAVDPHGKWCTFLEPGKYVVSVDLSEADLRDGLQYYPESQQIVVGSAPLDGISFSQLSARVRGFVRCLEPKACVGLVVSLAQENRPTLTANVNKDGEYSVEGVRAGVAELSVPNDRLCWREEKLRVRVAEQEHAAPPFRHVGYLIHLKSSHDIQVDYEGGGGAGVAPARGTWRVPQGESTHCVPARGQYTLTPRSCHRMQPLIMHTDSPDKVGEFHATGHQAVVEVLAPVAVNDLMVHVDADTSVAGPLAPERRGADYVYTHTMHLPHGAGVWVWASSSTLVMGESRARLVGSSACDAVVRLRARAAQRVDGRLQPPVSTVTLTLTTDDGETITTTSDEAGRYSFGPLDAGRRFTIRAEKEGYSFGERQQDGTIAAHKLAEVTVTMVNEQDGSPIEGGVVTVSGGEYRRARGAGREGRVSFALPPGDYYLKPMAKEYKFVPAHHMLNVKEDNDLNLTLRGTRVAWSWSGRLVTPGGAGAPGVTMRARPLPSAPQHCAAEDATTDQNSHFRIRGLMRGCEYGLELRQTGDAPSFRLLGAQPTLKMEGGDVGGLVVAAGGAASVTDVTALVRASVATLRAVRLVLGVAHATQPLHSAALDPPVQPHADVIYALPRVPLDNRTYSVRLEWSGTPRGQPLPAVSFRADRPHVVLTLQVEPERPDSGEEARGMPLTLVLAAALAGAGTWYARRQGWLPTGVAPPQRRVR